MCLAMNKDQWDPEFLKAIPIMKTRSGMQVSASGSIFREAALFFVPRTEELITLLFVSSFHAPLPATAVQTADVKCGCVTVTDTWDR